MIQIDERFSAERDQWCWTLHEKITGKDKDGNPKEHERQTYYPSFRAVLLAVMDRRIGRSESLAGVLSELNRLHDAINAMEYA